MRPQHPDHCGRASQVPMGQFRLSWTQKFKSTLSCESRPSAAFESAGPITVPMLERLFAPESVFE